MSEWNAIMSKLIILRGNSGSGKTTIAKELQKLFGKNTILISQDIIRREMLNVDDGKNTKALPLLKELLKYGNEHNEIVILEGILRASWYQSLFELAIELYNQNIYAYYFDLSFEETLKCHQTRTCRNEFGEKEMKSWWREKDFSPILNEITITDEKDIQSIVSQIYKTVLED